MRRRLLGAILAALAFTALPSPASAHAESVVGTGVFQLMHVPSSNTGVVAWSCEAAALAPAKSLRLYCALLVQGVEVDSNEGSLPVPALAIPDANVINMGFVQVCWKATVTLLDDTKETHTGCVGD